jgi:hypothetical protein
MYQWRSSPEERRAATGASRGNIPNPNTPTTWSVKRGRPIAKPYSGLTARVSHAVRRRCRAQSERDVHQGAALKRQRQPRSRRFPNWRSCRQHGWRQTSDQRLAALVEMALFGQRCRDRPQAQIVSKPKPRVRQDMSPAPWEGGAGQARLRNYCAAA